MAAKSNWIFACFQKDSARTESYTNGILEKEKLAEDWLQKYAPTIPSELAVQKSKQDLINAWLQQVKNSVGLVPFLIITGPSGCGKTTALRVLAKAQNIEVVEWITPLDIENYEYGFGSYMQSQSSKFQEFLASTGRYISVFGDGKYAKKLILVKDFPNVFLTQPNTLQSILRNYSTIGRNPVVFSIPEQMDGFNLMFPKSFIEELNIQQISFNKIPNKSVLKVLKNICYFNKNSSINDDILDKVIESCNGDIRNAVLQLSYENKCYKEVETAPRKLKRGRKDTKKKLQTSELNELKTLELIGKDIQIPIFQRVGRLLYPKKIQVLIT
ncbi:hypothetical protein L9F63_010555 [Diploptera punctata]|uniref:Cell cycle checkpoint protein RAD17 n=1 Tax=Diploptera punctata TaxID=6984 RepID=A0AAD8EQS1_DIPPU|nr:hypothetical protein L9F63_010555 [Diploptera punctata]